MNDGSEIWRSWWAELLSIEPFPKATVAPGMLRELISLPLSQWQPTLLMSPGGTVSLIVVDRLDTPIEGVTAGILSIPLTTPDGARFVYTIPDNEDDPGRSIGMAANKNHPVPIEAVAGWSDHGIAVIWHEFLWEHEKRGEPDVVRFLSLRRDGSPRESPTELTLPQAAHFALVPGGEGWFLLFDNWKGELFGAGLDDTGKLDDQWHRLLNPREAAFHHDPAVERLWATATPTGYAVGAVLRDTRHYHYGVFLVFWDESRNLSNFVQISDQHAQSASLVYLGCSGEQVCVIWMQSGTLLARLYDTNGNPAGESIHVAPDAYGSPMRCYPPQMAMDTFSLCITARRRIKSKQLGLTWMATTGGWSLSMMD